MKISELTSKLATIKVEHGDKDLISVDFGRDGLHVTWRSCERSEDGPKMTALTTTTRYSTTI
jgi:hypothetical protein